MRGDAFRQLIDREEVLRVFDEIVSVEVPLRAFLDHPFQEVVSRTQIGSQELERC